MSEFEQNLYFLFLILLVGAYVVPIRLCWFAARARGRNPVIWSLFAIIVPLIPWLILIAIGSADEGSLDIGSDHESLIIDEGEDEEFLITKNYLADIPGVGEKKASMLLSKYPTRSSMKRASPEEIARLPGISLDFAKVMKELI